MLQQTAKDQQVESAARSDAAEYLTRIDSILPFLKERSAEPEKLGRLPDEQINLMYDAGIFRAVQPKQWGGLEIHPAAWFESVVRVSSACGSSGWIQGILGGHQWYVGLYSQEAQDDVWGKNRRALIASSYAPTGKAERVKGGFRLTGKWGFNSGIDHAQWTALGGVVADDGSGPQYRVFLVPASDFKIDHDSWHVEGLQGSGSKDVTVDAVVPEHRTHTVEDAYNQTEPGRAANPGPLFQMPWLCMFGHALGSVAIGMAVGALDTFIEEQRTRVSGFTKMAAAENPFLYSRLAEAMTLVTDMRARIPVVWGDFYSKALAAEQIPLDARARVRYQVSYSMAKSYEAAMKVFEIAGGGVLSNDKRFQRQLRDLMGARNHPGAMYEMSAAGYARSLLGAPRMPFNRATLGCVP
jgi:3-hydroxy-9,10-secoandrosta-1,3,5(10)-triene-9,17-dione monooxygenase